MRKTIGSTTSAAEPTNIDEYLSTVSDDARPTLEALRRTIKAMVPSAVEAIGYGMPVLKYQGRPLIYFGAWKSHCAIYGVNADGLQDELAAYETSKGTIRFPLDKPLPEALLRTLVSTRIAEIEAAALDRKRKKAGRRDP